MAAWPRWSAGTRRACPLRLNFGVKYIGVFAIPCSSVITPKLTGVRGARWAAPFDPKSGPFAALASGCDFPVDGSFVCLFRRYWVVQGLWSASQQAGVRSRYPKPPSHRLTQVKDALDHGVSKLPRPDLSELDFLLHPHVCAWSWRPLHLMPWNGPSNAGCEAEI
jgi:hypothetical protein